MLLLAGNAAGNCKLKSVLVYLVEDPRALKWKAKGMLPVIWKPNSNAWVTETIFQEWFSIHFVPAVRQHCSWNNLLFKALLLLDNALGHRQLLQDFYPEIKVVFLPPNTTCRIQLMDLSFIAAFKQYYMRRVISQALRATDKEGEHTLKEFWKWYNIWNAVKTIGNSLGWDEELYNTWLIEEFVLRSGTAFESFWRDCWRCHKGCASYEWTKFGWQHWRCAWINCVLLRANVKWRRHWHVRRK